MKYPKSLLFLILSVITFQSQCQISFLGKKRTIYATSVLNLHNPKQEIEIENGRISYDFSIVPEFEFEVGKIKTSRINLSYFFGWEGLRNATLVRSQSETAGSITNFYKDKLQVRTNAINVGLEIDIFNEFAPVGKYIFFRFGYTNLFGKIYPTYNHYYEDLEFQITQTTLSKIEPIKFSTGYIFLTFGFGKSVLINSNLICNLGMRINGYATVDMNNTYSLTSLNEDDFTEEMIVLMNKNINNSFIPEVYVKFGFVK